MIIIPGRLETLYDLFQANTSRHHKCAQIILLTRIARGHEIGQGVIRPSRGLLHLLSQRVNHSQPFAAIPIFVQFDVVANAVGRIQAYYPLGRQPLLADDTSQQRLGVAEERPRRFSHYLIIHNGRIHLQG